MGTQQSTKRKRRLLTRGKNAEHKTAKHKDVTEIKPGLGKWRDIDGALQENILSLLCFGENDSVEKIISSVPTELFNNDVYRTIADRAIVYFKEYDKSPADHLPDLLEEFLDSPKRSDVRMYTDALHDIQSLSEGINAAFVLDSLQKFVRQQSLRQSITFAAEELKKGHLDSAERILLESGQAHQVSSELLTPIRSVQELMAAKIPPMQEIFDPVLQFPAVLLLLGSRGSCKTLLAMSMALAAASGKDLFNWRSAKQCRVLFLDFEMQMSVGKQRFSMLQKSLKMKPEDGMLDVWYSSDSQPKPVPNLCDRQQTNALIDQCADYDLVFLDNVAAAARGADLNKIEEIEPIRDLATGLQHRGTSCVLVHHLGKDPKRGARGSSGLEDLPDTILKLKASASPIGASLVDVTQTKSRHHSPSEFGSIAVSVNTSYTGIEVSYKAIHESKSDLVEAECWRLFKEGSLRLLKDGSLKGVSQKELAKQFDTNASTVSRAFRKVKENLKKDKENL